jgi:hypothetical protein
MMLPPEIGSAVAAERRRDFEAQAARWRRWRLSRRPHPVDARPGR